MPEVTVLLPARDDAVAVEATARSLLQQTMSDFEVLILHSGEGGPVALGGAAQDWRMSVVSLPGLGLGEVLNHGAALAQGDLLARVSAGDVVASDRFERQVALLRAAPDLSFVGTGWQQVRADGSVRREIKPPAGDAALRAAMATQDAIGHPTALMRRDAVLEAGGWRPAFIGFEDYDLLLRMLDRHRGACVPQVMVEVPAEEVLGWRALEQRMLSEMGAVAARDRRQVGRPDHGTQALPLDRESLYRMGMAEDEIARDLIARATTAAVDAGMAGEWRAMREAARLGLQQEGVPKAAKSQLKGLLLRSYAHLRPAAKEASDPLVPDDQPVA